jgi:hypothetical protein
LTWFGEVDYLTSLPIVLKPKPAKVRLEEVVDRGGWLNWVSLGLIGLG